MATRTKKRKRGLKWPGGFPDGPSRVGRRQHTKSRAGQAQRAKAAKKG